MEKAKKSRLARLSLLLGIVAMASGFGLGLFSCRIPDLGVQSGQLTPCPERPNCVCSQDPKDSHRVEPIALAGELGEDLDAAWRKAKALVAAWPRSVLLEETPEYVRYQCASLVFRFKDDIELLLDRDQKLIHVRAGARVGYSDMGVNRKRVEKLREELSKASRRESKND